MLDGGQHGKEAMDDSGRPCDLDPFGLWVQHDADKRIGG